MKARLRSTGLDDSVMQSPSCLLRDKFAARRSHVVENLTEVVVLKALQLDEVGDVLNVLKKLVTLLMNVGLLPGIRQAAR